jgi:hypothetical protein
MTCAARLALALLAALMLVTFARLARAEPPGPRATPVYVLSIWTEDADDTADALTQALRSRVRRAQGWSLLETTQSFETLAIALKCPARPDPPCLLRIADQIHADRYVWGTMARKQSGKVTAEMHLWSRGKRPTDASETYAENLKDAGDGSLRQIASRLFGRLTGGVAGGTLVVHAGSGAGSVTVDGVDQALLDGGVARVDLGGGTHAIGVRVAGFEAPAQEGSVSPGDEEEMTFTLSPVAPEAPEREGRSSFPTRKVVTYSALVAGGVLVVAGGIEGIAWLEDSHASKVDRQSVPPSVTNVCETEVNGAALDACQRSRNAQRVSALGWVFAGVGGALLGTGIFLMHDGHGSSHPPQSAAIPVKSRMTLLPRVDTRGGAVDLRVTF